MALTQSMIVTPMPMVMSVISPSFTSTLSTTIWKNSGTTRPMALMARMAMATCTSRVLWRKNSGMNQRSPNFWFSSTSE